MGNINSYKTDESQVKDVIQRYYPDWEATSVNRLKRTTRSTVYEVTCLNVAPRVVSILRNMTQEEATKEISEYRTIYNELRQKGVPVPEVLHMSQDLQELGVPYYVMTKLEGEQADTLLKRKIGQAGRDEIIQKIGDALYRIHQVEAQRVGALSDEISEKIRIGGSI